MLCFAFILKIHCTIETLFHVLNIFVIFVYSNYCLDVLCNFSSHEAQMSFSENHSCVISRYLVLYSNEFSCFSLRDEYSEILKSQRTLSNSVGFVNVHICGGYLQSKGCIKN